MQNGDDSYDFLYKIVLLGDMSVGKTCILSRYMKAMFPRDVRNTIGVEFATRTVALNSGTTVKA